jgi:hypothetical protein
MWAAVDEVTAANCLEERRTQTKRGSKRHAIRLIYIEEMD